MNTLTGICLDKAIIFDGVKHSTARVIPVTTLPATKKTTSKPLPKDYHFEGVAHVHYKGKDQSPQAGLLLHKPVEKSILAFWLFQFKTPVVEQGESYPYAVITLEHFPADSRVTIKFIRHFADLEKAREVFELAKQDIPAIRAELTGKPTPPPVDPVKLNTIKELEALAAKTLDPAAKKRHRELANEIRNKLKDAQAFVDVKNEEVTNKTAKHQAACNKLIRELFPNIHATKQASPEELYRAIRIDCARLGITAPVNTFAIDDVFAAELYRAIKSASPAKPAIIKTVVEWIKGDYANKPKGAWPSPASAKTIGTKYGLKSLLNGRPSPDGPQQEPKWWQ